MTSVVPPLAYTLALSPSVFPNGEMGAMPNLQLTVLFDVKKGLCAKLVAAGLLEMTSTVRFLLPIVVTYRYRQHDWPGIVTSEHVDGQVIPFKVSVLVMSWWEGCDTCTCRCAPKSIYIW